MRNSFLSFISRIGLPEVHIGLVPGATGTQKIPRVTSIPNAIDMITSGRHISAKEAHKMGIIDKVGQLAIKLTNKLSGYESVQYFMFQFPYRSGGWKLSEVW